MWRKRILLGGALCAVLGLAALPAGAATGDTTVQITLLGGELAISVPASATASGPVTPLAAIEVELGETTLTDTRGSLLGWNVTATATDLAGVGDIEGATVAKTQMTLATGTVAAVGGSALAGVSAGGGGQFGEVPVAVALAALGAGGGSYSYNPTVVVTVPNGAQAGVYTTTITQTAS